MSCAMNVLQYDAAPIFSSHMATSGTDHEFIGARNGFTMTVTFF